MADLSMSLSVNATVANPDEIKMELAELIGDQDKLARIIEEALSDRGASKSMDVNITPLEEMIDQMASGMGSRIDGLATVITSLDRTVGHVIPRVRPLAGRADLSQPLLVQLPEAQKLLRTEGIEDTIKENMGAKLPQGYSGVDYINTVMSNVERLSSNMSEFSRRDQESIKMYIKDAMNSIMIILDSKAFDKVGKGQIYPLPLQHYKGLSEIMGGKGAGGEKAQQLTFFEWAKKTFPNVKFSREETRGDQFVDIGTRMTFSEGGEIRGFELKNIVRPILSNEEFIKQVQRLIGRSKREIEGMAKIVAEGGTIQDAIASAYADVEYLPLIANIIDDSVQDITKDDIGWQQHILTRVKRDLISVSELLTGSVKKDWMSMAENAKFNEEGKIVTETSKGEEAKLSRTIVPIFEAQRGFWGMVGAKPEEKEPAEVIETFSSITEISKAQKVPLGEEEEEGEVIEASGRVSNMVPEMERELKRLMSDMNDVSMAMDQMKGNVEEFGKRVNKYLGDGFKG